MNSPIRQIRVTALFSILAVGLAITGSTATVAHAGATPLSARGDAFGTCDQPTFDTCAMLLQQQAQRNAEYELSNQCFQLRGSLAGSYCRTMCNPMMAPPPPNPTPVFTTCNADCTATCYVN